MGSLGSVSNPVTITNATVNGVTGLKLGDIPDLSSKYLALGGGGVAGRLSSFSYASTTELSVFGPAYFGARLSADTNVPFLPDLVRLRSAQA